MTCAIGRATHNSAGGIAECDQKLNYQCDWINFAVRFDDAHELPRWPVKRRAIQQRPGTYCGLGVLHAPSDFLDVKSLVILVQCYQLPQAPPGWPLPHPPFSQSQIVEILAGPARAGDLHVAAAKVQGRSLRRHL